MENGRTAPAALVVDGEYSDERFIDMMAAHHAAAIEMAGIAFMQSQNPRIQGLARQIIDAQSEETGQMIGRRKEWYPEG